MNESLLCIVLAFNADTPKSAETNKNNDYSLLSYLMKITNLSVIFSFLSQSTLKSQPTEW